MEWRQVEWRQVEWRQVESRPQHKRCRYLAGPPTYLLTNVLTNVLTHVLIPTYLPTYLTTCLLTHYTHMLTDLLADSLAHLSTDLPTYLLSDLPCRRSNRPTRRSRLPMDTASSKRAALSRCAYIWSSEQHSQGVHIHIWTQRAALSRGA